MIYCSQCNKYRQFNTVCRCDGTVSDVQDTLLKDAMKDKKPVEVLYGGGRAFGKTAELKAQITRINKGEL